MCCFYWLINKETAFGQWLNRIEPGWKKIEREESWRSHVVAAGDRHAGNLPVIHSHGDIQFNINGLAKDIRTG